MIAVPLVIEKIIRKKVFPKIQNNRMRILLNMPVINKKVGRKYVNRFIRLLEGIYMRLLLAVLLLMGKLKVSFVI